MFSCFGSLNQTHQLFIAGVNSFVRGIQDVEENIVDCFADLLEVTKYAVCKGFCANSGKIIGA